MAETGTALAVVESQQAIVGRSVIGGSSAVLNSSTDSSTGILEQIREISVNQLRVLRQLVDRFSEFITSQEESQRRLADQATEVGKEQIAPGEGEGVGVSPADDSKKEEGKEKGGMLAMLSGFLMGLPGAAALTKLLGPIKKFFGLFKIFGRFGPVGAIILGFTLLFKYSKEIGEALTPVVDKIKNLMEAIKPVTDVLFKIGDFLIKGIIEGIGGILGGFIDGITNVIDGFKKLFDGDIIAGINQIFDGIFGFILAIPIEILKFIGTSLQALAGMIEPWWNNLVLGVTTWVSSAFDSVIGWFSNIASFVGDLFMTAWTNIKLFFSDLPDRILGFVSNMFSPIFNFFKGIGAKIRSMVNGIIDSLPLPDFIKDKIKLDEPETEEDIDGVKNKYKEDLSPGEREARTGDSEGITQDEALAELTGEKYIKTNIQKSGTGGYDFGTGVLTPEQYEELNKLETTDQQIAYLKALNDKEQDRREQILALARQKIDFEKQQAELKEQLELQKKQQQQNMLDAINTMESPDDLMFEAPQKRTLLSDQQAGGGPPGYTSVNNSPVSINNVMSNKKADMTINKLNPSAGDAYFDRMFYNGA